MFFFIDKMRIKKIGLIGIVLACACALAWSCGKDDHLDVSPSELYGVWVQDDGLYRWTFNSDGNGNLVNTGEFDPEDENNGDFTWTINGGDELELEFRGSGDLGGIDIVKLFTIKAIDNSHMRWEDIYGRTTSLSRQ